MLKFLKNFLANTNGFVRLFLNVAAAFLAGYVSNAAFQVELNNVRLFVAPEFVNVCSLIVGLIVFAIVYIWEFGLTMENQFSGFSGRLQAMEFGERSIQRVGTALRLLDERYEDILTAASAATSVRNTLIFYHADDPTRIEASLDAYLEQGARKRYELISQVVKNHKAWVEICSRNVSRKLSPHIAATRSANEAFYMPLVMKKGWPVVNFVLFDGNHPEVWFGFGLFTGNVDGDVFRTKNVEVFKYFASYFDELSRGCVKWTGLEQESFEGTWLTAVYTKTKIKDCAVVTIQTHDGPARVSGKIFLFDEQQRRFAHLNSFVSTETKCVLDDDAVKLEFDAINDNVPPNKREVSCCYEIWDFRHPGNLVGTAKATGGNPANIVGRRLNHVTAGAVAAFTNDDMERFLTGLLAAGHIKPQPPLGDVNPFTGTMFH